MPWREIYIGKAAIQSNKFFEKKRRRHPDHGMMVDIRKQLIHYIDIINSWWF